MSPSKDENRSTGHQSEDNKDSKDLQVPADHPGMQKIARNENPRANENIADEPSSTATPDDTSAEAGSEITDGEDG